MWAIGTSCRITVCPPPSFPWFVIPWLTPRSRRQGGAGRPARAFPYHPARGRCPGGEGTELDGFWKGAEGGAGGGGGGGVVAEDEGEVGEGG